MLLIMLFLLVQKLLTPHHYISIMNKTKDNKMDKDEKEIEQLAKKHKLEESKKNKKTNLRSYLASLS